MKKLCYVLLSITLLLGLFGQSVIPAVADDTFTVNASVNGTGGTVDPSTQQVIAGGTASITITPDTGYHIDGILDNGNPVNIVNPYMIKNIDADHTVVVTFALNTYTINAVAYAGDGSSGPGQVIPTSQSVNYGEDASITITPATGYHIAVINDNGSSVLVPSLDNGNATYTIKNVIDNHNVGVVFDLWQIAPSATSGGRIDPDTVQRVPDGGDSPVFNFIPNPGYHLAAVYVDGVSQNQLPDSYQFTGVTASHTIDAVFAFDGFTAAPGKWWNIEWSRRLPLTVTNSSDLVLTDYQIKVQVAYDQDMKTDFGDVRFIASDNSTMLSYWLERKTDGTSADFWVKVPAIPANDSETIYLYYGNPSAESVSDIHTTFIWGDDFEDETWTAGHLNPLNFTSSDPDKSHIFQGRILDNGNYVYRQSGDNTGKTSYLDWDEPIAELYDNGQLKQFPLNYVAEMDFKPLLKNRPDDPNLPGDGGGAFFTCKYNNVDNKYEQMIDIEWNNVVTNKVVYDFWYALGGAYWLGFGAVEIGNWYQLRADMIREGNTNRLKTYFNGTLYKNETDPDLNYNGLAFLSFDNNGKFDVVYDNVRVREWAPVEPSIVFGTEEQRYKLIITQNGNGSVTRELDYPTYSPGTDVQLTAVPAAGWSFSGWSGGLSGSTNPATITMDGNKTVTATFTQNSSGSSGGGGGGSSDRIFLSEYMGSPGVFNRDVSLRAYDGICTLIIPQGTVGKTKEGWALSYIILKPLQPDEPKPPAPTAGSLISGIYRLEPDGVTFNPPIRITMLYREDRIPAGINEKDLVIAFWDNTQNRWVILEDSKVDTEKNLITASLSHFSNYAIIWREPAPAPAAFILNQVTVSPQKVQPGEMVSIQASVKNTGGSSGSYTVVLKINGVEIDRKEITSAPEQTNLVSFTVRETSPGTYNFEVNGYSGKFEVAAVPASTTSAPSPLPSSPVITASLSVSPAPSQTQSTPGGSSEIENPQSFDWKMVAALAGLIIVGIVLTIVIISVNRRKK